MKKAGRTDGGAPFEKEREYDAKHHKLEANEKSQAQAEKETEGGAE